MAAWLYQMAEDDDWTPEKYRLRVWEGEQVTWPHRKIVAMTRDAGEPSPGEPIVFFFAKSGTQFPGICGFGVILNFYREKGKFSFRSVFPTDMLKMAPIWDDEIKDLVNEVRGPHPRATMWAMSREHYGRFCTRIRESGASGRA